MHWTGVGVDRRSKVVGHGTGRRLLEIVERPVQHCIGAGEASREQRLGDRELHRWGGGHRGADRVLATSRDQGLETYRAWFPSSFYVGSIIGDLQVQPFDVTEAEALARERPALRRLLLGTAAGRHIARRPFFAAVLARRR